MKAIGLFPMSENYPVFKQYLQQALQKIEQRLGAPVQVSSCTGSTFRDPASQHAVLVSEQIGPDPACSSQ
jgi:hypothetical protein